MKREEILFLQAVSAALKNGKTDWTVHISKREWRSIFRMAESHRMLPMVFQAVYDCPAAKESDEEVMQYYRLCAMQMVMLQTQKSAEFLPLLQALVEAGVEPLVVKGITCRQLYPNPDHRMSSDEDILIPREQTQLCHQVMARFGMTTEDPHRDDYELPYTRPRGLLYIEVHRSLFPPDSQVYGDFNRFFQDVRQRSGIYDGIPTLHPTDHLLYLLMHAFKHFLHSGFGLRQVCDLVLFANRYGTQIDWLYILDCCRKVRAHQFAAGLFRIGWKYLNFSLEKSRYPIQWQAIYVDEAALLEDILKAGIYGSEDEDRHHSSTITLNAMFAQKQGKASGGNLVKSLFPSAKDLEGRYPYLRNQPLLLPLAWTQRIVKYGKGNNDAGKSIRIGNQRIELLKKYGILDKT